MLVLCRNIGERICIGDDIFVRVLDVQGNQARLGIEAPKSVLINREEVYERIQRATDASNY